MPAGVRRRHEAGQVADHAAADGHDDRLAIGAQFQQALPEAGGHVDRLARLRPARRPSCRPVLTAARLSATRMACGFSTFSSVITTACDTWPRAVRNSAGVREIARADLDVVAPRGQIDADGLRGCTAVPIASGVPDRPRLR